MAGLFRGLVERICKWKAAIHLLESAQYDLEYIQYCIEQEQTVSKLEASLHESEDPNEIAQKALRTACAFYGAEWAGILDVDLELDVWTPLWWYNFKVHDTAAFLSMLPVIAGEKSAVNQTWNSNFSRI